MKKAFVMHAIVVIDTEFTDQARRSLVALAAVVVSTNGEVLDRFETYLQETARDSVTDVFWDRHPAARKMLAEAPKERRAVAAARFAAWVDALHRRFTHVDIASDNPSMDVAAANFLLADARAPPLNFRFHTCKRGQPPLPTRTYRAPVICTTTYEETIRYKTPNFVASEHPTAQMMFPGLVHPGPKHTPMRDCYESAQRYLYHIRRGRISGDVGRFR